VIIYNDFKEFIQLLNKYKVKYLIVGGYAVSIYARPRNTDDIDFWIEAKPANAKKALKALQEFGFGDLEITIKDLTKKDFVIQLGQPPVRIDIITSVSGVEFNNAFKKREIRSVPGVGDVYFISYQDLIENKTKSGRRKDIDALNWIKEYGKSSS
jgi:predicted nucleotidyltransferase